MLIIRNSKFLLAISAALLIGACSTAEKLKAGQQGFNFTSPKDSKTMVACVSNAETAYWSAMEKRVPGMTTYIGANATPTGWMVKIEQPFLMGRDVPYVVDIDDLPNGGSQVIGYASFNSTAVSVGERIKSCL